MESRVFYKYFRINVDKLMNPYAGTVLAKSYLPKGRTPGPWLRKINNMLHMCNIGYHAWKPTARNCIGSSSYYSGRRTRRLFAVEVRDIGPRDGDKVCCRTYRILREVKVHSREWDWLQAGAPGGEFQVSPPTVAALTKELAEAHAMIEKLTTAQADAKAYVSSLRNLANILGKSC